MAKMMMGQITHARERVVQIKTALIGASPESKVSYDADDLVKALANGTAVFTGPQLQKALSDWVTTYHESTNHSRPSLQSVILNAAFSQERAEDEKRFDAEDAVYQARVEATNIEATKVEDAIVLGDNKAALDALIAFAAFRLS